MNLDKKDKIYYFIIILVVILILFLAYQDTIGFKMFEPIGGYNGADYSKFQPKYMQLFWGFAFALITVIAIVYYLFRRDISETLAIILSYRILLWGGLEDLFYYWLRWIPIDATLPWLDKMWLMGGTARLMGYEHVTALSLYISIIISIVATYFLVIWLKKTNFKIGNIQI